MFKKTRYKFIAISMTGLLLVLAFIFGGVNIIMNIVIRQRTQEAVNVVIMSENEKKHNPFDSIFGFDPFRYDEKPKDNDISMSSLNYIIVYPDSGNYYKTNIYNMDDSAVEIIVDKISEQKKTEGRIYTYSYKFALSGSENILVIVDISENLNILYVLRIISVALILFCSLIEFIFVLIMSKWAIKPLENAFDRQKRFISDASHELKTPLAVISANCDVLEDDTVNEKWINNIKESCGRMNDLVYNLLDLSRLDEKGSNIEMSDFNVSMLLYNTYLEFESTVFEQGKTINTEIEENVFIHGNYNSLKQLFVILTDNAVKHSSQNGDIRISLQTHNGKKIIKFYNTGSGIPENEKSRIFDRFYRSDESRSRDSGGYGLGLAIAKAVVDSHKGTINVDSVYGEYTVFTVILN